jgi:hypothetical protein
MMFPQLSGCKSKVLFSGADTEIQCLDEQGKVLLKGQGSTKANSLQTCEQGSC